MECLVVSMRRHALSVDRWLWLHAWRPLGGMSASYMSVWCDWQVRMLADTQLELTKALGVELDAAPMLGSVRSKRSDSHVSCLVAGLLAMRCLCLMSAPCCDQDCT